MNDHMMNEKKWNALRTALLTAVAVMLVLSAVMGSAWAYFTTYARAKGGYPIVLGHEEHDDEEFKNWEKTLSITVSKDSRPVYLRARAFCSDDYPLLFSDYEIPYSGTEKVPDDSGCVNENWQLGQDGEWWYYTKLYSPVDSGKDEDKDGKNDIIPAEPLHVKIEDVPADETEGAVAGDEFNVIIVYEATEVQYNEAGEPLKWDDPALKWDKKVQTERVSPSTSQTVDTSDAGSTKGGE